MYCCIHAPGNLPVLLDCARNFSPLIEEHADMVVFDIRGLEALYGPAPYLAQAIERRVGIPARIAIAVNPDAAICAACGFAGTTVVTPGTEAAVLAPLPLNLLGGSAETAASLDLWGVRTFGAFAALPPGGVAARLGDEGVALQRCARGDSYRRLRTMEEPLVFDAQMELDSPVELLDSLCFVLARLLDELLESLARRTLATNEIRVTLTLERAPDHVVTLRLPVPVSDAKALTRMMELELMGSPPPQAVIKVHLHAAPVKPRRTQHGLFTPSSPEAERLEVTLARVRHLVGKEHVGSPRLLDTHRPDSFEMTPFAPGQASARLGCRAAAETLPLCLRRFRPPRYARVLLAGSQPVHVAALVATGKITMAKGPWRISGDWWSAEAWNRDRWDIALESGVLFRLFQEIDSGRWFVEGSYD
jgi:protein ImuB